ncbi:hypothetical protein SFUMM280S_06235 [Streptomyces fumanus]
MAGVVAPVLQQLPQADAQIGRGGDDLGGHQRPPGERPALLEPRDVPGQRARQHDVPGLAQPGRAQGPSRRAGTAAAPGRCRTPGRWRSTAPRPSRITAYIIRVVQAQPDHRGRHPGHRRQRLEPGQDRPDGRPHEPHPGDQQTERRADHQRHQEAQTGRARRWSTHSRAGSPSSQAPRTARPTPRPATGSLSLRRRSPGPTPAPATPPAPARPRLTGGSTLLRQRLPPRRTAGRAGYGVQRVQARPPGPRGPVRRPGRRGGALSPGHGDGSPPAVPR